MVAYVFTIGVANLMLGYLLAVYLRTVRGDVDALGQQPETPPH